MLEIDRKLEFRKMKIHTIEALVLKRNLSSFGLMDSFIIYHISYSLQCQSLNSIRYIFHT